MEEIQALCNGLHQLIQNLRAKKDVDTYLEARYKLYEISHNVAEMQYMVDEMKIVIEHSKAEYSKENKGKYKSDAATERGFIMDNPEVISGFKKKEASLKYFISKMKSYNDILESISFSFIQDNVERKFSINTTKV